VPNPSLLGKEQTLINVLKTLASLISMCNIRVIFLSKLTPRYIKLFINGLLRSFNAKYDSDGICLREKKISSVFPR
jgi:hypothetical protein